MKTIPVFGSVMIHPLFQDLDLLLSTLTVSSNLLMVCFSLEGPSLAWLGKILQIPNHPLWQDFAVLACDKQYPKRFFELYKRQEKYLNICDFYILVFWKYDINPDDLFVTQKIHLCYYWKKNSPKLPVVVSEILKRYGKVITAWIVATKLRYEKNNL